MFQFRLGYRGHAMAFVFVFLIFFSRLLLYFALFIGGTDIYHVLAKQYLSGA